MLRTNRQTDKQTVSKVLPTPTVGVGSDTVGLPVSLSQSVGNAGMHHSVMGKHDQNSACIDLNSVQRSFCISSHTVLFGVQKVILYTHTGISANSHVQFPLSNEAIGLDRVLRGRIAMQKVANRILVWRK